MKIICEGTTVIEIEDGNVIVNPSSSQVRVVTEKPAVEPVEVDESDDEMPEFVELKDSQVLGVWEPRLEKRWATHPVGLIKHPACPMQDGKFRAGFIRWDASEKRYRIAVSDRLFLLPQHLRFTCETRNQEWARKIVKATENNTIDALAKEFSDVAI